MPKDASKLFQEYGPFLIEALALVVLDEVNVLRDFANLPERTKAQLRTALENKLDDLIK